MKLSAKHLIAAFSLLTVMAVAPTSAYAGGSVYFNGPGISIGVHDNHKYRKRSRKQYRNRYYNDRRYYKKNNYYSGGRSYYRDSYRNSNRYYDRGYDSRYDRNSYDRRYDRRPEVCPVNRY